MSANSSSIAPGASATSDAIANILACAKPIIGSAVSEVIIAPATPTLIALVYARVIIVEIVSSVGIAAFTDKLNAFLNAF